MNFGLKYFVLIYRGVSMRPLAHTLLLSTLLVTSCTKVIEDNDVKVAPTKAERTSVEPKLAPTVLTERESVKLIRKPIIKKKFRKKIKAKKYVKKRIKRSKKQIKDSVSLKAAALATSKIKLNKKKTKTKKSGFSAVLDMTFNTDTKRTINREKTANVGTWIFLKYKVNSEYSTRLWIDIEKDLAKSYKTNLKDTKFTVSKKAYKLNDKLRLSPSATIIMPTSEKSQRTNHLIFGLEMNASFSYKLNDKVSLSYLPRFAKNFHQYKTSDNNAVLTEYKSVQFYTASYAFKESWSFDPAVIYVNTWSYEGTRRDPSFLTVLEVGHQYTKDLSFAMGSLTGGSVLQKDQGPDESIEVYDKNDATFYGKFAYKF
jgi:hypothetical protein